MSTPWRFLAQPPDLPGLIFRGFRGEEDFPAMRETKNTAEKADGVDQPASLEDFAHTYRHLNNCDPATDLVIAEVDGEMVAYGRVYWWEEYAGARRYQPFCFVRPGMRRRKGLPVTPASEPERSRWTSCSTTRTATRS